MYQQIQNKTKFLEDYSKPNCVPINVTLMD